MLELVRPAKTPAPPTGPTDRDRERLLLAQSRIPSKWARVDALISDFEATDRILRR